MGDEIREINGVSASNQSVDSLQRMLRDIRGSVTFKIVPSYRSAPPACEVRMFLTVFMKHKDLVMSCDSQIFVRAQFDYDPSQDDLIPCSQAGVPFRTGDILQVGFPHQFTTPKNTTDLIQVISKDDHNWWQSRHIATFPSLGSNFAAGHQTPSGSVAGLIPSPELQEWRTACLALDRTRDNCNQTIYKIKSANR